MRKIVYFLFVLLVFLLSQSSYASDTSVQQQGFESFVQKDGKIVFSCKTQCVYVLGAYDLKFDKISLDISAKGSGNIGYGFVNGQQIVPAEIVPFSDGVHDFLFSKIPFISQIPNLTPIVMVVDGAITGQMSAEMKINTFSESISGAWNDFWTFDAFRPYTINLLYGPKIGGNSINGTIYILFILFSVIALFVLFFKEKEKKILSVVCTIGAVLWIGYDIRMTMEMNGYYMKDYKDYISAPDDMANFRDRADFYNFMDFTQKTLKENDSLRTKTVSFFTDSEWPFWGSASYFLLPYTLEKNKKDADILVFFGYKDAVISGNSLNIGKDNIGTGAIMPFSNHALIFIRK